MGVEKTLKIEPCLFEWTQWYVGRIPHWMTTDELKNAGFNIDETYQPMLPLKELKGGESIEAYYQRSHELMIHLLSQTGKPLHSFYNQFRKSLTSVHMEGAYLIFKT